MSPRKALNCKAVISQSPVSPDFLSLQRLADPTGEEKRKKKKALNTDGEKEMMTSPKQNLQC